MYKTLASLIFLLIALPYTASAQQLDLSECTATKSKSDDMFQGSFCMNKRNNPVLVQIPATLALEMEAETREFVAWAPVPNGRKTGFDTCTWFNIGPQGRFDDFIEFYCVFSNRANGVVDDKLTADVTMYFVRDETGQYGEILASFSFVLDGVELRKGFSDFDAPGEICRPPSCKIVFRTLDFPDGDELDDILTVDFTVDLNLENTKNPEIEPLAAVIHVKGFASRRP